MPSAARSAALSPWRVSGTQGQPRRAPDAIHSPVAALQRHAPRATVSLVAPDAIRSPVRPAIASFRESRGADVVQAVTLGFEWKRLWWEQRDPPRLGRSNPAEDDDEAREFRKLEGPVAAVLQPGDRRLAQEDATR